SGAAGAAPAPGADSTASRFYEGFKKGGDLTPLAAGLNQGVDWAEKESAKGYQSMADSAKGIPVVEQLAQGAAFMGTQGTNLAGGLIKGGGDLALGAMNTVAHPIDAALGAAGTLEGAMEHASIPGVSSLLKVGHGIYDMAADTPADKRQYGT